MTIETKESIASDTCLLCDIHCGHYYNGKIMKMLTGVEAVRDIGTGDYIFYDTCGNPVWICRACVEIFKHGFMEAKK